MNTNFNSLTEFFKFIQFNKRWDMYIGSQLFCHSYGYHIRSWIGGNCWFDKDSSEDLFLFLFQKISDDASSLWSSTKHKPQ